MKKEKLLVSFSGGSTSAYMLWWILKHWSEKYFIKVVFANTGKEAEETLKFVNDVSNNFSVPVVWVEFDLDENLKRTFKIVNYKTADRTGLPFEKLLSVMGIPSAGAPFCSMYLKREVIRQYMRACGWLHYYTAIGIRADEIDRISKDVVKYKLVYPLIYHDVKKNDINKFWQDIPYKLTVDKIIGNCDCCWKKSFKLLNKIAAIYPDRFNWWGAMELKYSNVKNRNSKNSKPPYFFFRGGNSAFNVQSNSLNISDPAQLKLLYNLSNGCSESCEVF